MSRDIVELLQQEIIDLQNRITHQEDMLASLNHIVVEQDKQIQILQQWMRRCQTRLNEVVYSVESASGEHFVDPPPPHY